MAERYFALLLWFESHHGSPAHLAAANGPNSVLGPDTLGTTTQLTQLVGGMEGVVVLHTRHHARGMQASRAAESVRVLSPVPGFGIPGGLGTHFSYTPFSLCSLFLGRH